MSVCGDSVPVAAAFLLMDDVVFVAVVRDAVACAAFEREVGSAFGDAHSCCCRPGR